MIGTQALLIVDIQNDFMPGGTLGVPNGDAIVPLANDYLRRFQEAGRPIFLTRDWHPPLTKHFNTQGGPWPPHCVQGTPGGAFSPALRVPEDAVIVSKGMDPNLDSYSAFDALGPRGESLDSLLRGAGVTHLYVGGLATDYCVRASTLDARRLGYEVTVLDDASRGISAQGTAQALKEIRDAGAKLITLAKLSLPDRTKTS